MKGKMIYDENDKNEWRNHFSKRFIASLNLNFSTVGSNNDWLP